MAQVMIHADDVVGQALFAEETGGFSLTDRLGGGIDVTAFARQPERYLTAVLRPESGDSMALSLLVYVTGEKSPAMTIRFGILPTVRSTMVLDKEWFKGAVLFPDAPVGGLKVVCHGHAVALADITKLELVTLPTAAPVTLHVTNLHYTDTYPRIGLDQTVLVDQFGQTIAKEWPEKIHSEGELQERLRAAANQAPQIPVSSWDKYGGDMTRQLTKGTGFFATQKTDDRWYLVDPVGNAFFSLGVDGVGAANDCRIEGIHRYLDWLPEHSDPEYTHFFATGHTPAGKPVESFAFAQANLQRAFGPDWQARWQDMMLHQLRGLGINTIGNWSDRALIRRQAMPYVTMLPQFPDTTAHIFRDFPDVFAPEYTEAAQQSAQALAARKDDPWLIGYFLRNEPSWAFVDHLNLGAEVLANPTRTATKERLVADLQDQYATIAALNTAWHTDFTDFAALYNTPTVPPAANDDLRAFSRKMVKQYVSVPAKACRAVDPQHLILGMRWAWVSDPDLIAGWEDCDVFSINCYAMDPTKELDQVRDLGVDQPVMIGEFHFGALDAGPTATGLEAVSNQTDRGTAFRHYCEQVAAHPNGIGCHYFQCYDQFALGRFDGENYNIGLFDICSQPYQALGAAIKETARHIDDINAGEAQGTAPLVTELPMIAY
ncbi:hypothetical protein LH991_03495 [Schleiferilactobacillus harbinensis]|uniref:Glycoside hydrolase family 42 N-terminal domain-containing protein n=1 Tax=Schleiferilactobacillus harbinensis DSM 16991 TaxID=1122147 RepID=A0A0R1XA30_9LACO|nr:beta-galactosidase [Schleiferilactobacillus harbinensis]KRM26800.1 hypothetical protein FC91_GL002881 [Schleiferilactobacillus harbinensis DSM 16991]MCT2907702.1 hypothetical protein [Schleiferilactobacillus harbinensis]QFR63110.1 hypothetical protein LH991_03495 [Schleiferilactobacillus harbinensis]